MSNLSGLSEQEKQQLQRGKILPIMEDFYTIQGEGHHSGTAAYFIRLGGCDVGCHWCDVKESWDATKHPLTNVNELVNKALLHSKKIVITGGEPLIYNLNYLTDCLKAGGAQVNIETSGAYSLSGTLDWICLSPKKFKMPQPEIYAKAHELKIVVFNPHDFQFAEEQAKLVSQDCLLYLQPEWSKRDKIIPLIVEYVKENPQWRISLQTHKYLGVP